MGKLSIRDEGYKVNNKNIRFLNYLKCKCGLKVFGLLKLGSYFINDDDS